ncbi:MAG: hypothetical protein HY306_12880 [Nitrosomonadales bacterium]|nr:hypothetical protein [Nitrosomonadales bacterium]
MIKAKDIIKIKPEYQDKGDEALVWVALEDEDGGRVRISPLNTGLAFPPNQVVNTEMLEKADPNFPIKE